MSNELSKPSSQQLPDYLRDQEVLGTKQLDEYVRPPRLKIVQAMSKPPFDDYDKGTILLVPQMMEFASMNKATRKGQIFKFVPIFFYPEWVQTNPVSKQPFVIARSLDPTSELAKKAKDENTWFEPHPDDPEVEVANREHLNFVVMPYDHPLEGTLCVMTFARASYKEGSNLAGMIKTRGASIFAQVFEAHTVERVNDKGQWYGLNINIPTDTPFVTQEEYNLFKELYESMAKSHATGVLQVDYEDLPPDGETAESSEF